MTGLPFLSVSPESTEIAGTGRGSQVKPLDPEKQRERLERKWGYLESSLGSAQLSSGPDIDPELVIVFETVQDPDKILRTLRELGMDPVSEHASKVAPDENFQVVDPKGSNEQNQRKITVTINTMMATVSQVRDLLAAWRAYTSGRQATLTPGLKRLFSFLKDVRPWSEDDRLAAKQQLADLVEWAQHDPTRQVTVHIELFYRRNINARNQAIDHLTRLVNNAGGTVHETFDRAEIGYHGAAVTVPVSLIASPGNPGTGLAFGPLGRFQPARLISFAPQGITTPPDDSTTTAPSQPSSPKPTEVGAVLLLDGLPLVNHHLLRDRVVVEDLFEVYPTYQANERRHGTQMASCILHGDLSSKEVPLPWKLLSVPIMSPDRRDSGGHERIPPASLPVRLIWEAVETVMERIDDGRLRLVNLSLGDSGSPFQLDPSPWARTIDWLSHRYNLLFVISAGNYPTIKLIPDTQPDLLGIPPEAIRAALVSTSGERRLLSPAESINAVTVGALHEDGSGENHAPGRSFIPDLDPDRVSPMSAFGGGIGASVKPDVLFPGGRQAYVEQLPEDLTLRPSLSSLKPGIQVASPTQAHPTSGTVYQCGTSFAAAAATRRGQLLLDELRRSVHPPSQMESVLVKALLVHGTWMPKGKWKELSGQYGYGPADLDLSNGCEPNRATIVAWGTLKPKQAEKITIPIPPELSTRAGRRRIITTLAWFSPINWAHRDYHQVKLELKTLDKPFESERSSVNWHATRRGTVFHDVRTSTQTAVPDMPLELGIKRKERAGESSEPIRYGLAVTIDVDENLGIAVYEWIRAALQTKVPVTVSST